MWSLPSDKSHTAAYLGKILFVLIAVWLVVLIVYRMQATPIAYLVTGWVLDYSAGFTRRGLLGAITGLFGDPESRLLIVGYVIKAIYLLVFIPYVYLVAKRVKDLNIASIMLVSPVLVIFPYSDPSALGRVEILGIVVTALNAYFSNKCLSHYGRDGRSPKSRPGTSRLVPALAIPAICISILLFIHEGALLIVLPINFMISFMLIYNTLNKKALMRSILLTFLVYLVPIACYAIIMFLGKSGPEFTARLCHNLRAIYGDNIYDCRHNFFSFHSKSMSQHIQYTLGYITHESPVAYVLYGLLGIFGSIVTVCCVYVGSVRKSISAKKYREMVLYYFVGPFLATLPLYIAGVDWARWIFAVNMNFVFTIFILQKSLENDLVQLPIPKLFAKTAQEKDPDGTGNPSHQVALIILTIFFLGIRMPHTYPSLYEFASPIVRSILKLYSD